MMPLIEPVVESNSETGGGFLDILSGGFSSLMDGVVTYGQLSVAERLREQFPEAHPPAPTTTVPIENAIGENALANKTTLFGGNNMLIYGGLAVASILALILVLKR